MPTHPLLDRTTSEAIARRNADVLARVDRDVSRAASALLAFVLAVLGTLALLHFATPCETAQLCMGVLGLVKTADQAQREIDSISNLSSKVADAVSAARAAGELEGEKLGFIQGTRYGVAVGACYGFLAGAITIILCLLAGLHKGYGL